MTPLPNDDADAAGEKEEETKIIMKGREEPREAESGSVRVVGYSG